MEWLDELTANTKGFIASLPHRLKKFQFGTKAQLGFLEDFNVLVADGIPANRAIEMMVQATTGLTHDVARAIAQKISEGKPLAEGMREWFGVNIVEIVRVGEAGGALGETLQSAINTLGRSSGSMGVLIGAVSYPLLVILMACGIIVYLDSSVFVQFKAIKSIDQWPQAGRDLVNLAALIRNAWWLVIAAAIAFVIIMLRVLDNYIGALRPLLDNIPPFSLYKKFVAARFMETLGLLVENGVVFKNALRIMQYRSPPYLASHLVNMEHLLSTGKGNVADILTTGLIDEKDVLRLRIMAEVKGFEHGLKRMGIRGAENTAKTMKIIARMLGGILLLVGAYLILTIIRGIFLTGMSMGQ